MQTAKIPINLSPYKNTPEGGIVPLYGAERLNGYIDEFGNVHKAFGYSLFTQTGFTGKFQGAAYWWQKDTVLAVQGGNVFKIAKDGTVTNITGDKLESNTEKRVVFALSDDFAYLANGGKILCYTELFKDSGGIIDHVSVKDYYIDGVIKYIPIDTDINKTFYAQSPDAPQKVSFLTIMDAYLICNESGTNKFLWSEVGNTQEFNPLNFASTESHPDVIIALFAMNGELVIVGTRGIEFWWNDGVSPFVRIKGTEINRGTNSPYSVLNIDNTLVFVDNERRFIRLEGRAPRVINIAYDKSMQDLERVSDAFAMNIVKDGKAFYVITFPTDRKTFVYDYALQQFQGQWSWYDTINAEHLEWQANAYLYIDAWHKHLIFGDNGKIYELKSDVYTQAGDLIQFVQRSAFINHGTNIKKRSLKIIIRAKRGTDESMTNTPMGIVRWRDDNGPWSNDHPIDLGNVGEYIFVKELRRLGIYRNRQWEIVYTDPTAFVLYEIEEVFEILDR